jgi:predicted nucleotidyltransferase
LAPGSVGKGSGVPLDQRIVDAFPFTAGDGHQILAACYMGSVSHGTSEPNATGIDDVDIMGVVIPPLPYLLGWQRFEQWDPPPDPASVLGELDCTFYDLRKLVRLWLKSNPNVLGLLWLRPEHYLVRTSAFDVFIANREAFSSRIGIGALRGYALGQMRDIDKGVYQGYMGAKRKALVEQFGYDCKHAAHTIRILRMGIEYCQTGQYNVWRGDRDADELRAIKRGDWSRDRVLSEADRLLVELDQAERASPLPTQPDSERVTSLIMDVLEDHLRGVIR